MSLSDIIWRPDPAFAERTRIGRFMRRHGLPTVEALQRRSVDDLEWYWNEVSRDLGWRWSTPYERVADLSRGIQWPRWFPGGRTNLTENCVDKHLARRGWGAGHHLRGGERREPDPHLCPARRGGGAARERPEAARRPRRGHRGRVPSDEPGSGDRHPRLHAHRRHLRPVLLRLRRPGRRDAPGRAARPAS